MDNVMASTNAIFFTLKFIKKLIADPTSIIPPAKVQNFLKGIYPGTKVLSAVVLNRCPIPNSNSIHAKKYLPSSNTDFVNRFFGAFIAAKIRNPPDNASILFRFVQYFSFTV